MLINVGAEFWYTFESSEIAVELIDILNKMPADDFILDFKDVMLVTMNYLRHIIMLKMNPQKRFPRSISLMRLVLRWGAADEACNP